MKTIDAAEFKEQCLDLLAHLDAEGWVVTREGKPVARVMPYARRFPPRIGSLRDKIDVRGELLTTGVVWDAGTQSRDRRRGIQDICGIVY